MPVDSQNKRASAIFVILPFSRIYPNPDGDLANVEDRTHMAWLYNGNAASAAQATGGGRFRTLMGVGL